MSEGSPKLRQKTNGRPYMNGSTPVDSPGNGHTDSDVISNGFQGYKEGYEQFEKTGIVKTLHNWFNKILFPTFIVLTCPNVAMLFWYTNAKCNGQYSELLTRFHGRSVVGMMVEIWSEVSILNTFTVSVVFGYCAWAIVWMKVLPGKRVEGPMTEKGNIPVYADNGFAHYLVTMAGFTVLTVVLKLNGMSPSIVYDRFGDLLGFMNVLSIVLCLYLYFKGIYFPSSTDCGKSGYFVFDYYWGTELYPRIFGIDIKVFTNCRFGMTVWPLLVVIYTIKSYELYGFVDSIFISSVLQLVYITKFFTWEGGYMKTIDIILDRAGFYICWGCLCWVPSLYALVSQFLVSHPLRLGPFWSSIVLFLGLLSILVNYLADLQRQEVRHHDGECLVWGKRPDIIRAKYMMENGEERENILLASGWWGLSRHFHYVPEILLSFFWTVPAGFGAYLPYTYITFLIILLTHRSYRDEEKCGKKYGTFWQQYCRKVPHRIVPYLF